MKVLTAKGGEISLTDELRSMVAYLDDGRLFISKSHVFNPHVRGFVSRLEHQGKKFQIQHCDLAVIAGYYESTATSETQSNMQVVARQLFERAVEQRASDIHIRVSTRRRTEILFRIHNDLTFIEEHTFEYGDQLCTTIFQAMADVSDATLEKLNRQDARISERTKIPEKLDGIRIATSPQVDGFIFVLRLLYNDANDDLDLARLGFHPEQCLAIDTLKKSTSGVVVIGGPTGSGKSTTLQRTLGSIIADTEGRKHIITVEDPPEYPIPGAVQTPVTNASTEEERSREYQKAIKASMRLDPDIIMLSEVRDTPSARLAVQAAMTGHQVWTTLHANNALGIIDRLIDLGADAANVMDPSTIAGLLCQRLVKVLCPHCKKPLTEHTDRVPREALERYLSILNISSVFIQGEGCPHCRNSGTAGRTVVAEVIPTDERLMQYLRDKDRLSAREYITKELGCLSMLDHTIQKINAGLVDPYLAEDVVGMLVTPIVHAPRRLEAVA
ncbi:MULTISPECIES: GspE/PulE family protein [unclassified Hydrogenophaga]|jgi:type II secretory ATPase GspE/PulE/Tfp pilus assembly ATPase PilB-like protein|uniref:GspE/PulE family protein n=1 Tax=unclassified Hydrogenophaga TaxID=2610897 RepID=UPI00132003C7|nr:MULTISPECIES: ATPase, T2SS/T4P/T4SS family [unclassified Hydrogenophaga]MDP3350463.1 ATPase, T2SS/T4P/T4SS family [Hydrogenophaga sp.]QHE78600.1 secretion system protein E [Hydrogenophaga sp. PBL-H3]QHE83025.1 secretion system protein E [Hydrogenophaga sp. PBL-H3]